jgi:ABC-type transport system involved in Fe-S cluster assembly fused permease/ATPase subunit
VVVGLAAHPLVPLPEGDDEEQAVATTCVEDEDGLVCDGLVDEASITEALIQDAIAHILEDKTVLVVAHRLSTVQQADRIAVMEAGRVVEVGNHAALMALGGRYAALVEAGREARRDSGLPVELS